MTTPTYCTSCGHELGVGRFCTNCGRPVPGRHPEAAPASSLPQAPETVTAPVVAPAAVPPPVGQLPPAARFPLYADDEPTVVRPGAIAPPPGAPPAYAPTSPQPDGHPRRSAAWLPWLLALVVLALVAGVGGLLLLGSDGDDRGRDAVLAATPDGTPDDTTGGEPVQPDASGTDGPAEAPDPDDVADLTADVTAEVPAVAPPSRDRNGDRVRYVPAHMWDGKARTAWRMPGDGTGETLVFDLGREVVITDVGLINGYAKVDGPDNWYRANRRIRAVQWEFDDGTRVTQELSDDRQLQMATLGPVATRTVRVHLVTVSEPGREDGRNFTAISEVRFLGAPA